MNASPSTTQLVRSNDDTTSSQPHKSRRRMAILFTGCATAAGLVLLPTLSASADAAPQSIDETFDVSATLLSISGGESLTFGATTYGVPVINQSSLTWLKKVKDTGYDLKGSKTKVSHVCDYRLTPKAFKAFKKHMKKVTLAWHKKVTKLEKQGRHEEALAVPRPLGELADGCVGQDRGKYAGQAGIHTYTHQFGKKYNSGSERTTKFVVYDIATGKLFRTDCHNEIKAIDVRDKDTQYDVTYEDLRTYSQSASSIASAAITSTYHLSGKSPEGNCVVDSDTQFTVQGLAMASASVSDKTLVKVKAQVSSALEANKHSVDIQQKVVASVSTVTSVQLTATVSASGHCTYTPPKPIAVAPQVTVDTMQNVKQGLSSIDTVHYVIPDGGAKATVSISAVYGTITSNKVTSNLTGADSFDFTYLAPAEPITVSYDDGNGLVLQPGEDAIIVTITSADGTDEAVTKFPVPENPKGH